MLSLSRRPLSVYRIQLRECRTTLHRTAAQGTGPRGLHERRLCCGLAIACQPFPPEKVPVSRDWWMLTSGWSVAWAAA